MRETLVPEQFGPLQGVRVLSTGSVIAQPFAAALAAQWGAEVIQVENPHVNDTWRTIGLKVASADGARAVGTSWLAERRNEFNVTLDMATPEGKEKFLKLAAPAETIFVKTCKVLGLDPADEYWASARTGINEVQGLEFDALLRGWCEERTMAQCIDELNAAGVACSPILNSRTAAEDPHYRARGVHIEWDDEVVGKVKGTGVTPRFSATPGKIWRGTTLPGADNERIFGMLE